MNERLCAFCSNDKFTIQETAKGIFAVCAQCGATVVIMKRRGTMNRETGWGEMMGRGTGWNPDGTMQT